MRDTVQGGGQGGDRHGAGDSTFDLWLRRSLSAQHDKVLKEGLPEEWLAILGSERTSDFRR